jgi:hypothetical protein
LEAATPGNTLPSKQQLLDFQARWLRPAGICAIVGALIFAASLPLQPSTSGDNDAERLTEFHDQSTDLIVGQGILIGLAVLFFIPALYVLFRSAQGRSERVRGWLVWLTVVGPVFFAISGFLVAVGLSDAADKFVDQAPAKESQARQQAAAPQPTTTTQGSTTTTPRTPEQAVAKARVDLANDVIDDTGLLQVGSLMRFVGLLSLVFAMIYIPLWCQRTGLLTRFFAMLGLALGVALLLVPVGIFGLMIWFAVLGLMLAGWWFRPLPPAWEAGEAIPWIRPGEDIGPPPEERDDPGTVEGSGRQVPEQPAENGQAEPQPGETPGQRRRKRKRRK